MGLFKRMSNLLSANFNEMLEHCEDPEKMLKQVIRNMETALGWQMDGAARAVAHERLLCRQAADHRREIERAQRAAELAVQQQDDVAARRALRRRVEHERLAGLLTEQVETAAELSGRLRGQMADMRLKLADARRKLLEITARSRAAAARRTFATGLRNLGDGTAVAEFDQMLAHVEQSEAETEALLEMLGEASAVTLPEAEIDRELQALKEKTHHVAH